MFRHVWAYSACCMQFNDNVEQSINVFRRPEWTLKLFMIYFNMKQIRRKVLYIVIYFWVRG
jgi:hypothetical protein